MIARRDFVKSLAAVPALLYGSGLRASAADPSRVALVIGNGDYRAAPLTNPGNDARAMTGLLTQAGFSVESGLNAKRDEMLAALERFGSAVNKPQTRVALFYYAGHGAQLDWRNYLLPVDAAVEKQEHIKDRCVDLSILLGHLGKAKDKSFIVILDACRNNPFGAAYKPEHKGLSQFDAPVGTLLAYATAPGNVAWDGQGANGLYTENLVRELSQRSARIEDALKRVRLNVRLASKGQQIPWETTSLESDLFLFDGQKKLSEAELERLVEADIARWNQIKSSTKTDDWVAYLRDFPNGRFAEIAQMRLSRLLAEAEKAPARLPVATPAVAAVAPATHTASATIPAIDVHAGTPVPIFMPPSDNPFSAGRYPLRRLYTVGDEAVIRVADLFTGVAEPKLRRSRVTAVDAVKDQVEFNEGSRITDLMGNTIKDEFGRNDTPGQFVPAEFYVGKKWTAAFIHRRDDAIGIYRVHYTLQIVRREIVDVPAGRFDTFKIEAEGWSDTGTQLTRTLWVVPQLNSSVRMEAINRAAMGRYVRTERRELVSLRQHAIMDSGTAI